MIPDIKQVEGATSALAVFAVCSTGSPVSHVAQVSDALVDTVAVAIAGGKERGSRILRHWAEGQASLGGATVWATGECLSADQAALLNGTDAHQLDYDDISPSMPMHPSAVLYPALLAVAESRSLPWSRLCAAYDVGAATFRAVCDVLPGEQHYAEGWHITSTVGRLAAVAALARLCELSVVQTQHALGIVASLIAGSRVNFGSMTKPLHAGLAAKDAVFAVELAERGFTASPEELDAQGGFFSRYGTPELAPAGDLTSTLLERLEYWEQEWVNDWGLKKYPACFATHRAIDALLELRDTVEAPNAINVTVHPHGTDPLSEAVPQTGQEAAFSMEYVLASAWLRGDVSLADFQAAALTEPERRHLAGKVHVQESPVGGLGGGEARQWAVVEVVTDSGSAQSRVEIARGDSSRPLSQDELRTKFDDCCALGGLDADRSGQLWNELRSVASGAASAGRILSLAQLDTMEVLR